jgi:hypothetical protein
MGGASTQVRMETGDGKNTDHRAVRCSTTTVRSVASCHQIGFFESNDDVMANLFKLQLGGARHWNIYTHSFLYFGVNGAWSRLNAALLWKGHTKINPCLPANSSVVFESWMHINEGDHFLPRSSPESTPYSATMFNNQPDFDQCSELTFQLLR